MLDKRKSEKISPREIDPSKSKQLTPGQLTAFLFRGVGLDIDEIAAVQCVEPLTVRKRLKQSSDILGISPDDLVWPEF